MKGVPRFSLARVEEMLEKHSWGMKTGAQLEDAQDLGSISETHFTGSIHFF